MSVPLEPPLENVVRAHLPEDLPQAELTESTPLSELGVDSLALVSLVFALEDSYGIAFDDEALQPRAFANLAELRGHVLRLGGGDATASPR